ncbi:TAP-like protein-domain-containing protein [Apiospora saccharicola]|uniref:TAP-like protein-domain-containing protein n=1 Tax=Apiospora saccharicola TaxID=335842 RepID=A0ABR1TJR1_9PEZI
MLSTNQTDSAIEYAPKYRNAKVLTIDGMGHTSGIARNVCGFGKVRACYQSNALPGNDSFCPLEPGPFGVQLDGILKHSLEQAGFASPVD